MLLLPPMSVCGEKSFIGVVDTVVVDHVDGQRCRQGQDPAEMVEMRVGNDEPVKAVDPFVVEMAADTDAAAGRTGIDQDRAPARLVDQGRIASPDVKKAYENGRTEFPGGCRQCREGGQQQRQEAIQQCGNGCRLTFGIHGGTMWQQGKSEKPMIRYQST